MAFLIRSHGRGLLSLALSALLIAPATGTEAEEQRAADRDGDGVPDAADRCPARAGLRVDGCPPRDHDGDQVFDHIDACPDQAGPRSNRGCPDADSDGDGVLDRADRCKEVFGRAELHGCPVPDSDGDGVADRADRCPDVPEVWNGKRDLDGCPDRGRALILVEGGVIRFNQPIRFLADQVVRWRSQWPLRVAISLLAHLKVQRLTVEVVAPHSLSYGHSLMRAQRRALAVRAILAGALKLPVAAIDIRPRGPDGSPRVELRYR